MRVTSYDDTVAAALASVSTACLASDGRDPLDEAARLHLAHHGLRDAALWLTRDGFALLRRHADRSELDLAVSPGARRAGIGRALLDAALADSGLTGPTGPVPAGGTSADVPPTTAWSHGDHPAAAALAAATGFRRTRELLVLAVDTQVAIRSAGQARAASGVATDRWRIRPWRPGDDDALLRVNAAAFAGHPEQGSMDADRLAERRAEPWFDPAGLLVATDATDTLVGFHWTKVHANGHGEVYVVAVDPSQHGRGLGRALLVAGLAHLESVDCPRVHLYVEADNAPALALYRGLGFATDHAHVQYARP
ncbi:hypothetical protein GCM10011584_32780 [Nocardioides phosphati]|uniref:Mycothiol acetyltransferase n=1 Tax=Nocardioides phosphati TaxID=1867775 RepID=A0ABQ2NJ61_9ACTN|nr:mycothiol synthase [Nocardioides phosphati]GGO93630.1 hypothetical protein GCM10011584_32780 [Nocardioides phosphati]